MDFGVSAHHILIRNENGLRARDLAPSLKYLILVDRL